MRDDELMKLLNTVRASIAQSVEQLPVQQDFLAQYCRASSEVWGSIGT
jgi:hypothetical protein